MKNTLWILAIGAAVSLASTEASANNYNNYSSSGDDYCREYTRTIYVGGQPREGYGTACMQPDGSWQIASGDNVGQVISPTYIVQQPQPVVYYQEPVRTYYAPRSSTSLSISLGNYGRDRHYNHGNNNWRGRGYGHNKHYAPVRRSGNRISWR